MSPQMPLPTNQPTGTQVWPSTTYRIIGFDRLNFVSDVADAVPLDDAHHIRGLSFESDGLQASGLLTIQVADQVHQRSLYQRLRSVRGIVSVQEIQ